MRPVGGASTCIVECNSSGARPGTQIWDPAGATDSSGSSREPSQRVSRRLHTLRMGIRIWFVTASLQVLSILIHVTVCIFLDLYNIYM